jgi:ubiquinone/menaquinone biosynthesis C-methylase UbiE
MALEGSISEAMMTIREAYSTWATTYDSDRNLTRDLDQAITRQTLSTRRYRHILELGCGTGKNTALLAEIGDQVYALDFSEGMIAQAKAKIGHDNVRFMVTDLTQPWPCADGHVDLIVCNLVLEHIENLDFIFSEAYRVLEDGGQFFISELHPFKQYQGKKAVFQRAEQQVEIPAFIHHVSNFLDAAGAAGFRLLNFKESWHEEDEGKPPRLASFLFQK